MSKSTQVCSNRFIWMPVSSEHSWLDEIGHPRDRSVCFSSRLEALQDSQVVGFEPVVFQLCRNFTARLQKCEMWTRTTHRLGRRREKSRKMCFWLWKCQNKLPKKTDFLAIVPCLFLTTSLKLTWIRSVQRSYFQFTILCLLFFFTRTLMFSFGSRYKVT